ncbi:MAG: PCRF domain-containing protein, partial [Anaerolineales bacterium]|nr:PCRF domain-containing protein [Anaerolineales bacterium]
MLEKIAKVVARYDEIEKQMADPAVIADYTRLNELAQERSEMSDLVEAYHQHQQLEKELSEARELWELETDEELVALAAEEIERLEAGLDSLTARMRSLLVPRDPRDDKNVYIEIRAGAGGDEAGIFAADLLRMYTRYAEGRNWKTDLVSENATGVGGYKEVTISVKGRGAYSRLKYESGVHRVQRVPVTESQGR